MYTYIYSNQVTEEHVNVFSDHPLNPVSLCSMVTRLSACKHTDWSENVYFLTVPLLVEQVIYFQALILSCLWIINNRYCFLWSAGIILLCMFLGWWTSALIIHLLLSHAHHNNHILLLHQVPCWTLALGALQSPALWYLCCCWHQGLFISSQRGHNNIRPSSC